MDFEAKAREALDRTCLYPYRRDAGEQAQYYRDIKQIAKVMEEVYVSAQPIKKQKRTTKQQLIELNESMDEELQYVDQLIFELTGDSAGGVDKLREKFKEIKILITEIFKIHGGSDTPENFELPNNFYSKLLKIEDVVRNIK